MRSSAPTVAVLSVGVSCGLFVATGRVPEDFGQDKQITGALCPPGRSKGVIKPDVCGSEPHWAPLTPKGAPIVRFILYDDTGISPRSGYGGRSNMPTLDRLAKNRLIFTQ